MAKRPSQDGREVLGGQKICSGKKRMTGRWFVSFRCLFFLKKIPFVIQPILLVYFVLCLVLLIFQKEVNSMYIMLFISFLFSFSI